MDAKEKSPSVIAVELQLPPREYEQLATIAHDRQLSVAETAQAAVAEWLERQAQVERARALMRELGQGLGEGLPPHDAARQHDDYLQAEERG